MESLLKRFCSLYKNANIDIKMYVKRFVNTSLYPNNDHEKTR